MVVLEYHKIGSPLPGCNSICYTPEGAFAGHLRYLHEGGWRVVDLAEFLGSLDMPAMPSERLALLTFDDAYRSLRNIALPRLREFGYPGVVFVPTNLIGGSNDFDLGREPREEICTWEDLHELQECGVSVQSHGGSHRLFDDLSDSELSEPTEGREPIFRGQRSCSEKLDTVQLSAMTAVASPPPLTVIY